MAATTKTWAIGFKGMPRFFLVQGLFPPPLFSVPEKQRDYSIAGKFRTPINMHIGNIGTTPAVGVPVNSNAPFRTGDLQCPTDG